MHPALLKLMRLQAIGLGRRMIRGMKTPRGAVFFLLGAVIFLLWLTPAVLAASKMRRTDLEEVRAMMPLILLGIILLASFTSASDKAIAFTPGEVDFLFPGPFPRRQLLFYKLGKSAFAASLSSFVLSVALLRYASNWFACYVGCFLTLLFVQFLSTTLVLIGQTMSEQVWSRAKRLILAAVALLVAFGIQEVWARNGGSGNGDPREMIRQFARSDAGRALLSPMAVFARTLTAERLYPDLLRWALPAAVIDAALLAVIVRLDANFIEVASVASQRRYERLRRFRAGGIMSVSARAKSVRKLPQPPFLFGAGPIGWRQLTGAMRSARGLLIVVALLALLSGPFMVASGKAREGMDARLIGLLQAVGWFSIVLASLLKFDFRADLDAMESLKALPLRPWAIALGQILAPAFVLTVLHGVLLAMVAAVFRSSPLTPMLWSAAAIVMPFNLLLFAVENFIFLLLPNRPATGPGDFQIFGRQMFGLILRSIIVAFLVGIAAGFGIVAYTFSNRSVPTLTAVIAGGLFIETAILVPLMGWAFRRFDPSMHTPA